MKVIRYTLLILLSLVLINLITYFLIGKQSLRERNISEMMKTEFSNEHNVDVEYYLMSELKDTSSFIFNGESYPTFLINTEDEIEKRKYTDSLDLWEEFTLDMALAESIISLNLDSIYTSDSLPKDPSTYDFIFRELVKASMDSIPFSNKSPRFDGRCNYNKYLYLFNCVVIGNYIFGLVEEIIQIKPLYSHQLLSFWLNDSHVYWEREEKLIWLFYKWVQIDWIDGNGLGGDDPSSKR